MAGHTLLVHPDVEDWTRARPDLRRRVDWLLFELGARGEAGRPKGVVGPASSVVGVDKARWRRSGVGGFHYYLWWFPASGWGGAADDAVVARAVRDHDEMAPLSAGDRRVYRRRTFADLDPLTEEQAKVLDSPARVRLVVGQPGTGKTSALIFAALREASGLPSGARLLYVTLSRRLSDLAGELLGGAADRAGDGAGDAAPRVEVVPLADLLALWSGLPAEAAATEEDEERAFLEVVRGFAPRVRADWQGSDRALWAEVRAHVLGAALPFPIRNRNHPASAGPLMDEASYHRIRDHRIGAKSARAAWQAARLFLERRDVPSVQRMAWTALKRLQAGALERALGPIGGLIVDEIQDLTLLQIAVLAEAARRGGAWSADRGASEPHAPLFIAAGDESQIVHPSGFDWGWCKDLLTERLGSRPEELSLRTNQRSAAPVVEVANRTARLYDELQREYRPRGSARAEPTEAANGEVALATLDASDDELTGWLELLAETPHSAVVVPKAELTTSGPALAGERFRDLLFTPAQVKGLDRQYVVVWDASRTLDDLRREIEAAHDRGQRPRFLAARTAIDELRVGISRANETLVFVDPPDVATDPLLAELVSDGLAQRRSIAFLRDCLEERSADPRERALGFLEDARALLDSDLDRALRTLVRVEASLANLVDPDARRGLLLGAVEVRRRAAHKLIRQERHGEAAEQFERLVDVSRELGDGPRAAQYGALARRYREAPPGEEQAAERLPGFVAEYVAALEALPEDDRAARLYDLPRAWIREASALRRGDEGALRTLLDGARRLARLSGADRDREAADALAATLADALLDAGQWRRALDLLADQPDAPPEKLARCHEGLKAWRRAAEARLRASQPAEALRDYRRAAAFPEAAALAAQLGEGELAELLGLLAGLTDALGRVSEANLADLTPDEAAGLARRLREAADVVIRRRR